MLLLAFLFPFLNWAEAAGGTLLAVLFVVIVLPQLVGVNSVDRRGPNSKSRDDLLSGPLRIPGLTGTTADAWAGLIAYPLSMLALILIFHRSLYVVAAVWAIVALGDTAAGIGGRIVQAAKLPYNREKTWLGSLAFLIAGSTGAYVLTRWTNPTMSVEKTLLVTVATAGVGAVVESLPIRLNDNISVPLICAGFMFCACMVEQPYFDSNVPYLAPRLLPAVTVNLVLALVAWKVKATDESGAFTGFFLGTMVYLAWGYKSFLLLFSFLLLASAATRLGFARKAARGVAERRGGVRSWREALANILAGAFFAVLVLSTPQASAFLVALVAVFAEATGDTVSSEIGQWLSSRAYLITTLMPVPAGENGSVSTVGSVAGVAASVTLVSLGFGLGLVGKHGAVIALASALAGNLLDSLLGATLERRGLVTNGIVNFAATVFAGALALALTLAG